MKRVVAAQIVGFKNTGKTQLCKKLAEIFNSRGLEVTYIKMCHHHLDKADSDTDRLSPYCKIVMGISPSHTGIFFPEKKDILSLIPFIKGDVVLIEGGKETIDFIPRIVVAEDKEEIKKLTGPTTLGIYFPNPSLTYEEENLTFWKSVEEVSSSILDKGFFLPGANCKGCGFDKCAELAREILAGRENIKKCKVLNPKDLSIEIDGNPLPTNPFVERIITSTICGLLTPLKGFTKGNLRIKMQVK